jgi:predicted ArsR family transcriptional regulator
MLLKMRDGLSTKALAEALDISVPAVRQHLRALGGEVTAQSEVNGVGRPAQIWRLTATAQHRFPDTHGELTVKILESVEKQLGAAALDRVIEDRSRENAAHYAARLTGVSTLQGKLQRLAQIRSDEGYMAQVEKTADGWRLIENHCPICAAATYCQGFCRTELEVFRQVLGDGVKICRSEYLLEGGSRCTYEITLADAQD